jgi:hypothetical protein
MTNQPTTLEAVTPDHLHAVTGGGIGSDIGGIFGAKGTKWGGIADKLLGMFGKSGGGLGGLFGQGGQSSASNASSSGGGDAGAGG